MLPFATRCLLRQYALRVSWRKWMIGKLAFAKARRAIAAARRDPNWHIVDGHVDPIVRVVVHRHSRPQSSVTMPAASCPRCCSASSAS